MSERITYPKGLNAVPTANLNSPPANSAIAARQLSAAESRMMSQPINSWERPSPPPPSMISELGGSVAGNTWDSHESRSSLASGNTTSSSSSMSGAVTRTAGVPGDSSSTERAKNIPAGGEVLSEELPFTTVNVTNASDWRVKISAPFELLGGSFAGRLEETGGVVFPYLPTVAISTTANYNTTQFTHNNYPFNAYKNSVVDDITITGEFSCETLRDAEYWLSVTQFFRGATKMFFGASSNTGNPPIICKLNGYGTHVFNDISCVIKNFSITLPNEVDYILCDTQEKTWVPILSEIAVTLSPIYSREKIRKFNLQDFASGNVGATKGFA